LPKKIQFNLLLADLALEFGNAFRRTRVSSRNIACPLLHARRNGIAFARPTDRPQRLRPTCAKKITPCIEILTQHIQLLGKSPDALTRQNATDRLKLELSAENTG
jgi:hypothetical protein